MFGMGLPVTFLWKWAVAWPDIQALALWSIFFHIVYHIDVMGEGVGWAGRSTMREFGGTAQAASLEAHVAQALKRSKLISKSDFTRKWRRGKRETRRTIRTKEGPTIIIEKLGPRGDVLLVVTATGPDRAPEFRQFKGLVLEEISGASRASTEDDQLVSLVR